MTKVAKPVLIFGATSDIGRAIAHAYARSGRSVILAARSSPMLESDVADLAIRYTVNARAVEYNALDSAAVAAFCDNLGELPETVISVVGLLGDQAQSQREVSAAELVIRSNYEGPALTLGEFANRMEVRGHGTIIGISSVAGDRGRASNYVYGSAKAGLTAFLSGLRNRLAAKGVNVITVKPGFVNTRMTADMKLPRLLTAEPAEVAAAILRAEEKRRDIVYVRPVWRLIMLLIRAAPEKIFKKMQI